ncbi:MAG TPA: hypothetical protein VKZ53_15730 [Candidatus Angelobacter sp.]|nr:hypothetical protein [Candidatus Angelobacter sp.]
MMFTVTNRPLPSRFRNLASSVEAESFLVNARAIDHEKIGEHELADVWREFAREARQRANDYRQFADILEDMFDS